MSNNVITLPQFDEMLAVYLEYGDIFNKGMSKFEQLCSEGIPISFDETDRIFQEHESTLIDGKYVQFGDKLRDVLGDIFEKHGLTDVWKDGKVYIRIGSDWDFQADRVYYMNCILGAPANRLTTTGKFNANELEKYLLRVYRVSSVNELTQEDCDAFIKLINNLVNEFKASLKSLEESAIAAREDVEKCVKDMVNICAKHMYGVYCELYDTTYFMVKCMVDMNAPIGNKSAKNVMSELCNGNFDEWYYGEISNGNSVVKLLDLHDYVKPLYQDALNDMISDLNVDGAEYEL